MDTGSWILDNPAFSIGLCSVGFLGGLKGCETRAVIDRGELTGLDGYDAVLLWNKYQRKENQKALETLFA